MIKVNTDVSMKNPYDVLKITSVAMSYLEKKCSRIEMALNRSDTPTFIS